MHISGGKMCILLTVKSTELTALTNQANLTVGDVQNFVLKLETRPRTEQFRQHSLHNILFLLLHGIPGATSIWWTGGVGM